MLAIEFGLWQLSGALPNWIASLQFVALRLVITRLPLVPNKDLIFVGAGLAAAGAAHAAVTPVATVLVILAAADLILAATVAGLTGAAAARCGARMMRDWLRVAAVLDSAGGGGLAAGRAVLGPAGVRWLGR